MKREEEIIQRAKETALSNIIHEARGVYSAYGIGFIEGAKWADKHPRKELVDRDALISKMLEWLLENFRQDSFSNDTVYIAGAIDDKIIEDFKKAMIEL